jgi:predicted RNase H-like nuclease
VEAVGLDACRGKWLAVALEDGRFAAARLARDAAGLVAEWPHAAAIGVDIPIGLPETPGRDADREARAFVGARRSSVFATFPAVILRAATHEDAKKLCVARSWPRPSFQSFGMRHRIFEIERLATADERIVEVHPEVSFRELAGRPLSSKTTAAGASERRRALAEAGIHVPDLPYPVDDVLDAAVVAWTAMRYAIGEARPLPEHLRAQVGAIWR